VHPKEWFFPIGMWQYRLVSCQLFNIEGATCPRTYMIYIYHNGAHFTTKHWWLNRHSVEVMIRVSWVRFSAREFHFLLTQRKKSETGGALYVSKLTTNNSKLACIAIWLWETISILSAVYQKKRKRKNMLAQRGARTHDPEIKSLMLYRLS
jgi:hypothetical protein